MDIHEPSTAPRDAALTEWRDKGDINGWNFLPSDGICFSCRQDIVQHYIKTGYHSATGCPYCHRSFLE